MGATPTLKARPTVYRGTRMRSRLEATFAANLDRFGIDWRYEPCAYGDERRQYLPDFYLPALGPDDEEMTDGGTFIEVRPVIEAHSPNERRRAYDVLWSMDPVWSSAPRAVLAVASPSLGSLLLAARQGEAGHGPETMTGWFWTWDEGAGAMLVSDDFEPFVLARLKGEVAEIDWQAWR